MSTHIHSITFSLFAEPSFTEGMARIMDFSGALQTYNEHETPAEADRAAIASDWLATGDDLRNAIRQDAERNVSQQPG